MIWLLWAIILVLGLCVGWLLSSRNRYRTSAKVLANDVNILRREKVELDSELKACTTKPLTRSATKAQDAPKRLTGAQLRRVSDRVNVEATAAMQERPNSEILQEQV